MATALRDQDGMVKYFGWFQSHETQNGLSVVCYNLILELGDMDLSEAFQKHLPPTSPLEIKEYWERMNDLLFALKEIHTLDLDGLSYNMYEFPVFSSYADDLAN